jgi:hypothetical protein
MYGKSAASEALCCNVLTFGLCILAFMFAVEAKTAWYGPMGGPGSVVRAAKALPAEMPKVIEHGIPVPDPIHPGHTFAMLASLVAEPAAVTGNPGQHEQFRRATQVSAASYFSPQFFFRPPPFLS